MALPGDRFEELVQLADRLRDEAQQREREKQERRHQQEHDEQTRRQQLAEAMPDSSRRFEVLRTAETQQRAEAAQKHEAEATARQAAEARANAEKAESERSKAAEAKALKEQQAEAERIKQAEIKTQQEQQTKTIEQLAARSWKMTREASGTGNGSSAVQQLFVQEERRIDEERRQIEKNHPGNTDKLDEHFQFRGQRLDAILRTEPHLRGKSPEQINQLAREGFQAEQAREAGKIERPSYQTPAQYEAVILARNHRAAGAQLRPEQATTDTRGFEPGEGSRPVAAPRGEITDRKAGQQNENARPKTDLAARAAAARALKAQRGAELEIGDGGGRPR